MTRETLLLSRADVARHLPLRELASAIGDAYMRHSTEPPENEAQRAHSSVDGSASCVVNFPGLLRGYDCYTVKVNARTPSNRAEGLPLAIGTILLIERATGRVRAILESSLVTAMRTAAAGALGATVLARPGAATVALFGAGVQGTWHLGALQATGRLGAARIFDVEPARAAQLAEELQKSLELDARPAKSPRDAIEGADMVVLVTPSRVPLVDEELIEPGMHVSAFGADEPGKVELSSALIRKAKVVVDNRALALTDGALNVGATAGELDGGAIHAELGEVLAGRKPGRERDDEITIFASVGLAFQDLVAAQLVYDRAVAAGAGTWIAM